MCDLAGTTKKENIAPRLWLKGDDTIASGGWRKRRADEDPMLNNWKEPDSVPGARALHAAKRGRTAQAALMALMRARSCDSFISGSTDLGSRLASARYQSRSASIDGAARSTVRSAVTSEKQSQSLAGRVCPRRR